MKLMCYKESATVITEIAAKQLIKLNCSLTNLNRSHNYSATLHLFQQIYSSQQLQPDHYTLSTALAACAHRHATAVGNQIHSYAIKTGFKLFSHVSNTLLFHYAKSEDLASVKILFHEILKPDVYSWTTLLSACTKLGQIGYACNVLDVMPDRNVALWNAVITGCVENGRLEIAFDLFRRMQLLGVRHDNYTFASVLTLCTSKQLIFGKHVHSMVIKTGFLVRSSVTNALLTMYFNCGSVSDAYEVFELAEPKVCDEITYNVMIGGLATAGRDVDCFIMFKDMQDFGLRPTELTFVSIMSSCSCLRVAVQAHAEAIKMGFENFTSVSNAAMNMYSTFGDLGSVNRVFERLGNKDVVSWNTLITSYAQGSFGNDAIMAYLQMEREGIEPDEFTIGSLLASSEFLITVEMIHSLVSKNGLICKIEVCNALLSAFSKHGEIEYAYQVFDEMPHKSYISWNSMISGFQLNGFPLQGLEIFSEMLESDLNPNTYTLTMVLSICSSISALTQGKQVHGYILKNGLFGEPSLGNALIALYAKSGVLHWSLRIFSLMSNKDIVSWNSMISAYAQHGQGTEAINCFETMQTSDLVKPDKATFTAVLSACSHAGLVKEGIQIFNSMVNKYGFQPGVDQFSCIVDLLARGGYFDAAEGLIIDNLNDIDSNIWWTLFSSCAAHGNLRLGRIVADFLLQTEQNNPAVYVLLSNIYADAGQWEEGYKIRDLMKSIGVKKQPGCSWMS